MYSDLYKEESLVCSESATKRLTQTLKLRIFTRKAPGSIHGWGTD